MTIWVNVTTSANWRGNPVGISRVERELASRLIEELGARAFVIRGNSIKPADWALGPWQNESGTVLVASQRSDGEVTLGDYGTHLALHISHLQQQSLGYKLARLLATAASIVVRDTPEARQRLGRIADRGMSLYLSRRRRSKGGRPAHGQSDRWLSVQRTDGEDCEIEHPFRPGDTVLSMGLDWDTRASWILAQLRQELAFTWINAVYDLIPWDFPHAVGSEHLRDLLLGHFTRLSHYCDAVWCISAYSEERFVAFASAVGADVPSTTVILLANEISHPARGNSLPLRRDLAEFDRPIVLTVGTFEIRKNYSTLMSAMLLLAEEVPVADLPVLVIVGRKGWLAGDTSHRIETDTRLTGLVRHLEDVSDEELAMLYRSAAGYVSASEAEGFGLPVFEALEAGLPVVVSDIQIYRELFPLAPKVRPFDQRAWADALLALGRGEVTTVPGSVLRTWDQVLVDLQEYLGRATTGLTVRR